MTVQTFNPTDLSQSTTNWAVAQRIVGPFAPHAQVTPNLTLALDPGYLLSGTTLTEVNAQSVGPFAPPVSGFRIDRVVIDRSTGAGSIVTGAVNSLTPPAIPVGKLPVARVMLQATTDAITNAVVVDERALFDLTPPPSNSVICRAHMNGVDQTGVTPSAWVKANLSTAEINVGNGFDTTNKRFAPQISGYYAVSAIVTSVLSTSGNVGTSIYKNGTIAAAAWNPSPIDGPRGATVSTIVVLNGTTDYIEVYGATTATNFSGSPVYTYMIAQRIG